MTLKVIEIWNLNRFKGTYKHEKVKNQKQLKREEFSCTVDEKKQDGFTRLSSWNVKRILFRQMQQEKMQHENLVSNDQ